MDTINTFQHTFFSNGSTALISILDGIGGQTRGGVAHGQVDKWAAKRGQHKYEFTFWEALGLAEVGAFRNQRLLDKKTFPG